MPKPSILLFSNWFGPGFAGGGSQTAATNLIQALNDQFDFFVVTRDRDVAAKDPYPNVASGKWNHLFGAHIRYLEPSELTLGVITDILRSTPHDLLHLNSVVSVPFSIFPLLAQQFRAASSAPVLVSPHGELAPGALAKKRFRKSIYLQVAKALRTFDNVTWHAANSPEEQNVRRVWGESARIEIAPVIPSLASFSDELPPRPPKSPGSLRVVFFGRIDRMKNLDLAIDLIAPIQNVTLDICGPVGQPGYWAECEAKIAASGRPDAFRYRGGVLPNEIGGVLSQYDVLLLPSENESFGYAILDALSAGCPVMTSDRTPWTDLESAGVGFALELNGPDRFRAELLKIRDLDEEAHALMRARARAYARNYVANSTAKRAMSDIYTRLLAGSA